MKRQELFLSSLTRIMMNKELFTPKAYGWFPIYLRRHAEEDQETDSGIRTLIQHSVLL
jgi:hypothetical protein